MRRLNEMMALRPFLSLPGLEAALFRRLQAFEMEAKAAGAPRETLLAIAAARRDVALADLRPWLAIPRGH